MPLKDQLMNFAMKAMQNDTVQKVLASERFQHAMAVTFRTTFRIRTQIDNAKKDLAAKMNLATKEEVRDLRRSIERIDRRVKKNETGTENP